MKRVLAYTSPARGHLYPLTPILLELRDRGHEVGVRTLASEVPMARSLGLDARPIDPAIEAVVLDDWRARTPQQGLAKSVRGFADRAPYDAADLLRAIEESDPDLVVVDINSWGAIAAAERWGGPWAVFCPYPLVLSSADVPPFGPGLRPARGPAGRLRDRLVGPVVRGTMERTMLPPLNALRADMGLRPVVGIDSFLRSMPLLLSFTAEPFEYARSDWPANVVMVGASPWEPPADPPDWLLGIDEPIVLVTTSSEFQDDGRLVEVALEALADEPVHVIATVPSAGVAAARSVPGNAHVATFLPHSQVLPRAACAITHGGMGATQKALALGVPVCAVPFGRDQMEVARRVEVAGAGTRLPARRLRPDRLRAAVLEAMGRREGATRVAAGYAAAGGPLAAADALEGCVVATR
jgi:MGT family glycosyltransferase